MKNLKLMLVPMLLLGMLSFSCSSDDDSSNNMDVIVGEWKISDVKIDGESVYAELVLLNPCPFQNQYHFRNDFSIQINTFEENSETGNCVAGEVQNGTWSKSGNVYSVSINNETNSSTANFIDDNNFTTQTEFEGQPVELKFTKQ